ncbi:MAG TPA: clostripain-related cysteine peptidase, partial [Caldilineaceae bacterium]|nr:clostripain-related cysteine peptidase [Caldilineaceae bacterium]
MRPMQKVVRGPLYIGLMVLLPLMLAWLAWLLLAPESARAAEEETLSPAQTSELCAQLQGVTQTECMALSQLYASTNGGQWENQTNWMTATSNSSPCDWYGVVCAGGHVVRLELSSNRLTGVLPRVIGDLSQLTHLQVNDNRLGGNVPGAICALTDTLQLADFAYNRLSAKTQRTRGCLNQIQPDWAATQTARPRLLRVTAIATDSIELRWRPIPYSGDGGYYEIGYSTSATETLTLHGRTADKLADSYLLDGLTPGQTYYFGVRSYTPAHPGQENELRSDYTRLAAVTQAPGRRVLVMVYFPADNDLSSYVDLVVQRLRIGTVLNPNVVVALLADKLGDHNTVVAKITGGVVQRTEVITKHWGVDELDTSDPAVLSWFLRTAREEFPADRTVVALLGHGAGMTPEVLGLPGSVPNPNPDAPAGIPSLPQGQPDSLSDITNGSYASTADYSAALAAATDNGANPFDVVFFDQCFQGNLDVLYEVRTSAHTFVASPNYAWFVAAYHKYLTAFTPTATPEKMAQALIHHYQQALSRETPNVIFWVSRAKIEAVAAGVNQLSDALQQALAAGRIEPIGRASFNSEFVDTTQCGRGNLRLGPPDELLGIESFARNLRRAFGSGDPYGVSTAAEALLATLDPIQRSGHVGSPYLEPEVSWTYTDTLTLLAPLRRDGTANQSWRASIYRAETPISAVWAP